jgi:K+ transporter
MVDFDVLPYAIAIATVAGVIGTWVYNSRTRKDRITETRQTLAADVEKIAREKIKEEQSIARDLAVTSQALALDVKQNMKEHIQQLISTLKQDIALSAEQAEAKIDKLDYRLAQIKIDLMEHIMEEKDEKIRMQRSIEMLQTMNYGIDAKSEPAFLVGKDETQEHKDKPGEGLYKDQTVVEKEQQTKENEERIDKQKKR